MSYIFEADEVVVWSPALKIGDLYLVLARFLADHLGIEFGATGLAPMANDFYLVDPPVFAGFIRALLGSSVVQNPTFQQLARGFLLVSLVMLDRAGVSLPEEEAAHRELFEARSVVANIPQL